MQHLDFAQTLMLAGLALAFGAYFALTWHKHKKGREMIISKDERLYPDDYDTLTKSDRKRLYRVHSWHEAWDGTGKFLALLSAAGVAMFVASLIV